MVGQPHPSPPSSHLPPESTGRKLGWGQGVQRGTRLIPLLVGLPGVEETASLAEPSADRQRTSSWPLGPRALLRVEDAWLLLQRSSPACSSPHSGNRGLESVQGEPRGSTGSGLRYKGLGRYWRCSWIWKPTSVMHSVAFQLFVPFCVESFREVQFPQIMNQIL